MAGIKVISVNKKARHDYFLEKIYEAGIVLVGTEVKSLRLSHVELKDSYVVIRNNEAYILNLHINQYKEGNLFNHDPLRSRKLLLSKKEIRELSYNTTKEGFTLVPTRIYFKNGLAKLEFAVAKGKKLYDKRETEKKRTMEKERQKMLKNR